MKCTNCGTDMEGGYSFRLGILGIIKIERLDVTGWESLPRVFVYPKCGKVEMFVDYNSIKKAK